MCSMRRWILEWKAFFVPVNNTHSMGVVFISSLLLMFQSSVPPHHSWACLSFSTTIEYAFDLYNLLRVLHTLVHLLLCFLCILHTLVHFLLCIFYITFTSLPISTYICISFSTYSFHRDIFSAVSRPCFFDEMKLNLPMLFD